MAFFHPDSFWNSPLPSTPRHVYGNSYQTVQKLSGWVHQKTFSIGSRDHGGWTPWLNEQPIYRVNLATPRVKVTMKPTWDVPIDLQTAFNRVPLPPGAVGDSSTDASITIVDEGNGYMWDMWQFDPVAKTAAAGCAWTRYWHKSGIVDEMCWGGLSRAMQGSRAGVRASGFPLIGGVIMAAEVAAGVIPHTLAVAVPWAKANLFAAPATRTDGQDASVNDAIPYGALFVLPWTFDYAAYCAGKGFSPTPFGRTVAEAMKRYGVVAVDQTSLGVALILEGGKSYKSNNPGKENPWYGADGWVGEPTDLIKVSPANEMKQLPWEYLDMLFPVLRQNVAA